MSHCLFRPLVISLVFAVGLAGCAENGVVFSTWESVDVDEVRARVANPTGSVSDAQTEEFLAELERIIPYVRDATELILHLIKIIDEAGDEVGDDGTVQKDGTASESPTGTQAFLGVACPGQGEESEFDFTHGEIKVETPTFQSEDDVAEILEDNDILISFETCELPSVTLQGEVPARFLESEAAMILWFAELGLTSIHGEAADVEEDPDLFDENGDLNSDLGLSVDGLVVQLSVDRDIVIAAYVVIGPPEDSYTIEMVFSTGTGITVRVNAVDGSFGCTYDSAADPDFECTSEST